MEEKSIFPFVVEGIFDPKYGIIRCDDVYACSGAR
jgi:hypothetical protein